MRRCPVAAEGVTFRVEGPVRAEVFVVWLSGDHVELTGPCGSEPWLIEVGPDEHPVDVVTRIVGDVVGPPRLVHSTSWRQEAGGVVLSFVVVIDASLVGPMASEPVGRAVLARSTATAAPRAIASEAVVEHGLRTWLAGEGGSDRVGRTARRLACRPLDVRPRTVQEPRMSTDPRSTEASADTVTNRCACGWEITGRVDEVVGATIEHGQRIHNMVATRAQVLTALGRDPEPEPAAPD